MKNNLSFCDLKNARIIRFENGIVQSMILVEKDKKIYSITISNSHKFIVLNVNRLKEC